jgi:hypothetical protein
MHVGVVIVLRCIACVVSQARRVWLLAVCTADGYLFVMQGVCGCCPNAMQSTGAEVLEHVAAHGIRQETEVCSE